MTKKFVSLLVCMILTMSYCTLWAQNKTKEVWGIVVDSVGLPLEDASVTARNTGLTTRTNAEGSFKFSVPENAAILVVARVGYETREVSITNDTIRVALKHKTLSLNDVTVVSVGYGTLDKKEVTSAITHLSGKDLNVFGGNAVLNSIQGKVAGLSVVNTGTSDPNSSPSIQLRGVSSRNAGLGPLYIINGVPGGNVDNLNQNDIESIDVLKGGAASAIYGTRGSNGVIIITTKKGTSNPYALYDGYASFDLPTNRINVLSPEEFIAHNRGTNYGAKTDWFKSSSHDYAFNHKHTLQFAGGGGSTNYIVSFDYRNANGLDLRSTKQEYGGRLNLTHTSANKLYSVTVNIAPRYIKSNNSSWNAFAQSLTLNPTLPIMDTTNPSQYLFINTGFNGSYNAIEEMKTVLNGSEGKYLDWSGAFKLNISKDLYSQITLGQQTQDWFGFYFSPSYNTANINGNNGRNQGSRAYDKTNQQTLEWIGNYKKTIDKHNFNLLAGYSYNYFNYSGLSAGNQNFPSDVLTYNNIGTGVYNLPIPDGAKGDYTFRAVGTYKNDSRLIAFFGRLNYDYDKKYYVSASLRREGSSKFGYDHKWEYFPAVSLGWRLTQEEFFPKTTWIDELKLRGDYGATGNQDFGSYLSLDTYTGYGYYTYNGSSYQVWGPSQNANYNLKWEVAQNFNLGLDFELFQRRVTGSLNYYIRKNKDLLGYYNVPVPPNIQTTTFANVGTMENSGFEIQLNAQVVNTNNFKYNVTFAGATNNNKFVSFSNNIYKGQNYQYLAGMSGPGSPGNSQRLEEGRRIGSFYMFKSAGVDATGRLMVYDKNGNIILGNTANEDDKRFVGNGLPKFTASFGNSFSYKNLDVSVYFRGVFGYDLFNTTAFYIGTPVTQGGSNVLKSAYGKGKYAVLTNPDTYSTLSDYFLEKGDFVKIDNVTIGYSLKSPIKQVSSIRLYFAGRNLYTFTKFSTGDPEAVSVNGLAPGINTSLTYYPSTLQLMGGVQIRF